MPDAPRLAGLGVAVTRDEDDEGRLTRLLRADGARVVHWPCVRFAAPDDPEPMRAALDRLGTYDWVVVTSPRAAKVLAGSGRKPGEGTRTAVAGPATARVLEAAGWDVDRTSEPYGGSHLVEAFAEAGDGRDARILFPASDRALASTRAGLEELGAEVDHVVAYRTLPRHPDRGDILKSVEAGHAQVVTFASPSAVEGFVGGLGHGEAQTLLRRVPAAAIGGTTAAALAECGCPPAAVAAPSTMAGLVAAVVAAAGARAPSS